MVEQYKFQKLQVYQLALKYVDAVYALRGKLPQQERFNLSSQIERAAPSIVLIIAEGSTYQVIRLPKGASLIDWGRKTGDGPSAPRPLSQVIRPYTVSIKVCSTRLKTTPPRKTTASMKAKL